MSVRIQFARPRSCYTNLDFIDGRVILSILQQETIAAITVKLEGESRTRLAGVVHTAGPYNSPHREGTQLEVHKLLYDVKTVFPTSDIAHPTARQQFTLTPGQYEYPFRFRIPINNNCTKNNSLLSNLGAMRMEMSQGPNAHVRKILPPSLGGLPGEAEIQYYVKATVQRPAFYKENFRALQKFLFLPIEPRGRPAKIQRETFGKRTHAFAPKIETPGKNGGLFRKSSKGPADQNPIPPSVAIEGRLPDPAVLFCNERIPLRILVTKQNETNARVFLQSLHIEVLAYTGIRAHELRRSETTSWLIMSSSDMKIPIGTSPTSLKGDTILEVDPKLWNQRPLPNTITPTFDTCNLSRTYSLDIKIGLSWGMGREIYPELTIQPIRMPVQIWSGIPVPQPLLDAAAGRLPPRPPTSYQQQSTNPQIPLNPSPAAAAAAAPQQPPRPSAPHQPSDHIEPSPEDIPPDAPPSYEEAMADGVPPIDGPRSNFEQEQTQGVPSTDRDEKKSLFSR